jgi:hypothetical protein
MGYSWHDAFQAAGITLAKYVQRRGVFMNQLKYPDWQEPFEGALQECDSGKILSRISASETAISMRIQTLGTTANGDDERQAIADASNALVCLMRGILNSPDLGLETPKESRAATI